jgi:hypothetical protein
LACNQQIFIVPAYNEQTMFNYYYDDLKLARETTPFYISAKW